MLMLAQGYQTVAEISNQQTILALDHFHFHYEQLQLLNLLCLAHSIDAKHAQLVLSYFGKFGRS